MKRRWLTRFFGRIAGLFYRVIRLGAEVPATGPVIFVANHPNGLVDPVVVGDVARRRVLFLAKAPIFRMPVLGRLARLGGAIPVYRRIDGADTSANESMFREVYHALAAGSAIVVFPEGISHNEPHLQPLKTGAARMALGAEAEHDFGLGVQVIPIGLTYRSKTRFQSEVAVEVGQPIAVADFHSAWQENSWQAVEKLTEQIARALRAVTLELEDWEDLPLLRLAADLLPDDGSHRVQRLRTLAAIGRKQADVHPHQVALLRKRLSWFRTKLKLCGLELHHLDQDFDSWRLIATLSRNLLALVVGLPIMLLGTLSWWVPYRLVAVITRRVGPDQDVLATVKMLAALVVLPPWHLAQVWALAHWAGPWWALAGALVLPVAGFYARHFWRRRRRSWREAWVLLALPFQGRLRRRLLADREALRQELWALVPADLDP